MAKEPLGVIFDQRYTDSALRLLAPKLYKNHHKRFDLQRALPKQEILSSLLLFGKAYLCYPNWLNSFHPSNILTDFAFKKGEEVMRLEREGLIDWIPSSSYQPGFEYLNLLLEKEVSRYCCHFGFYEEPLASSRRERNRFSAIERRNRMEREIKESELGYEIAIMKRQISYVDPLIRGNLKHFEIADSAFFEVLTDPNSQHGFDEDDDYQGRDTFDAFAENYNGSFLNYFSRLDDFQTFHERETEYSLSEIAELIDDGGFLRSDREIVLDHRYGMFLDATLSSLAAETFASDTLRPIKTNGREGLDRLEAGFFGLESSEAYQLIKIQFQDLRYPVIETVDDVLRLREDPHLDSYRAMIAEYSHRLRKELEQDKSKVLTQFRHDMRLALKALKFVNNWSKAVDLSFYFSIPLTIIGTLYGIPLSDIIIIPLTSYAKIVSHQKRRKLDWILLGRPGS